MNHRPIRFLVLDDHPMIGEGLRHALERFPDLTCSGVATSAAGLDAMLAETATDVLLLDIRLKDEDGLNVCRDVVGRYPALRVLVVTSFADAGLVDAALGAGATGLALKSITMDMIPAAVRQVARGEMFLSSELASEALGRRGGSLPRISSVPRAITPREREVVELVARGFTNKEIARLLSISADTVKQHVSRLLKRHGFRRRAQLVALLGP